LNTTIRNSQQHRNCPATAIIGHGGSGKSVALRRLALDLVEQGYQVWWVENPTRLIELGLDDFIDNEGKPQFLLIDEIQDLDSSYVERLRRHLKQHPFLVLVVAGRRLPNKLKLGAKDQFTPNEAADRITILDKIAEVLPAWATTAAQLKAESLREARLVRILVVLARRQEPVPKTLEELEEVFLQILVDDLERIREQFPGLATAIMDAAVFQEVGMTALSISVLIALADDHQPHAGIPILFEQVTDNLRWDLVTPLLSFSLTQNHLLFHHDELAEGLIQASQARLTQPYIDDAYRKVVLDRVIRWATAQQRNVAVDKQITATASSLLQYCVCQRSDLVNQTTVFNYIHQLLNAEISHHDYLSLIVNDALSLERQERLNLLLTAAQVAPNSKSLWGLVWKWVNVSYPKQRERILQQLYQAGCRSSPILNGWIQILPLEKAKPLAKEWIQKTNQHPEVLCRCLKLLGEEAKEQALVLLSTPEQNPTVLCRCLELLGEEAKKQARVLLSTPEQNPTVLCRCLELLGEEAKEQALVFLSTPEQNPTVLCRCLKLLGEEAKEQAFVFLSTPGQDKDVLCKCLNLLGEEAKKEALVFLSTPGQDKDVLCKCLNLLGEEAKKEAQEKIASWVETHPDVLSACFAIAGDTPEAQKAAEEILWRWQAGTKLHSTHKIVALRAPFDTELRQQMALQVLNNWHSVCRPLVASALTAFCNDPDAVTNCCRQLLKQWHQEIKYRHRNKRKFRKRNIKRHDGHIIKALAHPSLRKQAQMAAMQMLQTEANSPGFLTPLLYQRAFEITQGKFLSWNGKEGEETEPLQPLKWPYLDHQNPLNLREEFGLRERG
ncbi:MAG: ATP-binding protein, partial [Symploca sp. SIO1A3]|nr:ATP-binding protein [Symploca sp. SIO1A3]